MALAKLTKNINYVLNLFFKVYIGLNRFLDFNIKIKTWNIKSLPLHKK